VHSVSQGAVVVGAKSEIGCGAGGPGHLGKCGNFPFMSADLFFFSVLFYSFLKVLLCPVLPCPACPFRPFP
jgi:hypothetical protein